jgi:protease-4
MGKNGSKVGFWIAIAVLAMLLFGSFLTNVGLFAALFSGSAVSDTDYPVDEEPSYEEVWSYGYGDTKVVRIDLVGVIMRGQRERLFGYEPDMVEAALNQIRAATNDSEVKAILLEVDSPGGAVTPSDEIYAALRRFKAEDEERIILVFIRGLGASGAYYAAMAGDYLMAEPTAIVGSIGVIMQTLNMKGLGDKLGLRSVTIASGENKDMLNPFKEVDPVHMAMLQELVNGMQDRFATIVEESRGFDNRDLLDGRIFSAPQALEHNFIDGIGYWQDAIDQLELLLGVDEVYLVRYSAEQTFFEMLMASRLPHLPDLTALEAPPRFLYQWKP